MGNFNRRSFDSRGGGSGGSQRSGPRRGFDRDFGGPREEFSATCADCNQECKVPFKPSGDRPVYCKECYRKRKPRGY